MDSRISFETEMTATDKLSTADFDLFSAGYNNKINFRHFSQVILGTREQ